VERGQSNRGREKEKKPDCPPWFFTPESSLRHSFGCKSPTVAGKIYTPRARGANKTKGG